MTLTIKFDEAEEYRKAAGCYLRKNQWEDITIDVYIWYYTYYIGSRLQKQAAFFMPVQNHLLHRRRLKNLYGNKWLRKVLMRNRYMVTN